MRSRMLLPNSIVFGNEHSRMADGENMKFILNRFVYDTIGTAEDLLKAIGVFRRCSETFYRDCCANRREVDQLVGGVIYFEFPSSGILNRQLKSDSRKDVDEELLSVRRPLECHAIASSRFQLSRRLSMLRMTSSWGMPLPSANSRREISMSRVSSIWSKRLSRSSASTRYEAARPFCVIRMGRRVSRTRAMYVERLLRHSEKGTMSSEGRQRLIGKSSVRGIISFPFVFVYYIVQDFALNGKRVSAAFKDTRPIRVMRPSKEGLAA